MTTRTIQYGPLEGVRLSDETLEARRHMILAANLYAAALKADQERPYLIRRRQNALRASRLAAASRRRNQEAPE